MIYLEKLKKELDNLSVIYFGCSQDEIKEITNSVNGNLPKSYLEFLELFGKNMYRKEEGSRGFLVGSDVFYRHLFDNMDALNELLSEDNSSLELATNSFVFYGHQGYIYSFFKLDEGENPAIYGYQEGFEGEEFPKIADSLSSFYERYLEGDKTLFEELRA